MPRAIDITGQVYGRLTVIKQMPNKGKRRMWECRCECGNICIVEQSNLRCGNTMSCGCFHSEVCRNLQTKHGQKGTRLYQIWKHMKDRCCNKNSNHYKDYGGRGIFICDEWKNDFSLFYEWAYANGYNNTLTIERINNDDGYFPSNCKWATRAEQRHNTRPFKKSYLNGKRISLQQLSKDCGIAANVLQYRLSHGWPFDKAIFTPVKRRGGTND